MSAGEVLKTDETGEDLVDVAKVVGKTVAKPEETSGNGPDSVEDREDDAWINACQGEHESDSVDSITTEAKDAGKQVKEFNTGVAALSADVERLRLQNEDGQHDALVADLTGRIAAMEKTGTEAMSKLGQAMGVIAERIDDLEERAKETAIDRAAESSSPSRRGDVAPYIENAERELEAAKQSGPLDIFDRIAQAAESQFDESRGSTALRVSKLVDDRRVGTKKWTPSKTVKKRMEKLEAARVAAEANAAESESADATQTATAPGSATAETVSVGEDTAKSVNPEAPVIEEKVVITRRDKQTMAEEAAADSRETSEETASNAAGSDEIENEDDDASLRIIPGARGRRRDRARKSRLDEDFEKIFEGEEGKPSIGSLRRKLRVGSKSTAEATEESAQAEATGTASVTEEVFGAETRGDAPVAKTSLFSRLFKRKAKPVPVVDEIIDEEEIVETDETTEAMIDAFESDEKGMDSGLDFETAEIEEDEVWDQVDSERPQSNKKTPLLLGGVVIAATGVGVFLYRAFLG